MIFTEIENDTNIRKIGFGTHQYYYPASLVKLPVALLALEKMKRLGLTMRDYITISKVGCGNQNRIYDDKGKLISFETLFEEMMVVSDNQFYTVLYQFLTPKEINEGLKMKGFTGTHIYKSFAGCDRSDQLKCYPISVSNPNGEEIYVQTYCDMDSAEMMTHYEYTKKRLFGSKHEDESGEIVDEPYDLNYSIEIPLDEVNEMLIRLIYPDLYLESERWDLRDEDVTKFRDLLMELPREMTSPKRYPDNKYKYAEINSNEYRTASKIGLSYGFTSEVVYMTNPKNEVNFFLAISLFTNENDIVNDGVYEYETVARPFIASLFKLLNDYQLAKGLNK